MATEPVKTEAVSSIDTASNPPNPPRPPGDTAFFGHPSGLLTLFFAEMWERFSFYGMRAILGLFLAANLMNGGFQYSKDYAGRILALYLSSVYLSGMAGGWLADNVLGQRRSVLYGGIIIMFGHICLALHGEWNFFVGLILIVIGTGLLKPNISTIVGQLYKEGDDRRDAGFSIYYMGINLGSFLGQLTCGSLAQTRWFRDLLKGWGMDPEGAWHFAFGAAAVGMFLGVVVFLWRWKLMGDAGLRPLPAANEREEKMRKVILAIGSIVFVGMLGAMAYYYQKSTKPPVIADDELVARELGIRVKPSGDGNGVDVVEIVPAGAVEISRLNTAQPHEPAKLNPFAKPQSAKPEAKKPAAALLPEPVPWKVGDKLVSLTFRIPYRDWRVEDLEEQKKTEIKRYEVVSAAGIADVLKNEAWRKGHPMEALVRRTGSPDLEGNLDCQTTLLPLLNIGLGYVLAIVIAICFAWLFFGGGWEPIERNRLSVVMILFFASTLFWAAFEQASGSLNFFAANNTRCEIFGTTFPSTYFQNVNPFAIFVLAPLFAMLWVKLADRQPSSPAKFAIGMFLVGGGFVVAYFAALAFEATDKLVAPYWLVGVYLLHTAGELCLSPVGLSMVTKLSPPRAVSRVMGIWFLSNALANWLSNQALVLEKQYKTSTVFGGTAAIVIVFGMILVALTPFIKKLMGGVR